MSTLVVVDDAKSWALSAPDGVRIISAVQYLTEPDAAPAGRTKVVNLCRSYRYQRNGYYVSLLATARGHRAIPSVRAIQDLLSSTIVRVAGEELEREINRVLKPLKSQTFELSVYFGRNTAQRYDSLARALFNRFPAPLLRAEFKRTDELWRLDRLRLIGEADVPDSHRSFLEECLARHVRRARPRSSSVGAKYDVAVLVNPDEDNPPSDARAIERFAKACGRRRMSTEVIGPRDMAHVPSYDGLFIRETTAVHHHTYRFASRAEAEGLLVIDDPESILRCSNKVYLAELFSRLDVPAPRTMVVHGGNRAAVADVLGLPCVVKQPDSAFSLGVKRADTQPELERLLDDLLARSELVVAQEYLPSSFDWRIGVLGGEPLFACRYHMAKGHWQIASNSGKRTRWGDVDTLALSAAPSEALSLARRIAGAIGQGFYGVDIKEVGGKLFAMEINDNPNLEAGCEDLVLGEQLYDKLADWFFRGIESR